MGFSDFNTEIIATAFIVAGALFCVLGYHFIRYLIGLAGFIIGGMLALWIYDEIPVLNEMDLFGELVFAAVAGLILATLFYLMFIRIGVYLFGAIAFMWLASLASPGFSGHVWSIFVLSLGFTGGVFAITFSRQILIISTSLLGSLCIVAGLGYFNHWSISVTGLTSGEILGEKYFTKALVNSSYGWLLVFLIILFFVAGLIFQNSKFFLRIYKKISTKRPWIKLKESDRFVTMTKTGKEKHEFSTPESKGMNNKGEQKKIPTTDVSKGSENEDIILDDYYFDEVDFDPEEQADQELGKEYASDNDSLDDEHDENLDW